MLSSAAIVILRYLAQQPGAAQAVAREHDGEERCHGNAQLLYQAAHFKASRAPAPLVTLGRAISTLEISRTRGPGLPNRPPFKWLMGSALGNLKTNIYITREDESQDRST